VTRPVRNLLKTKRPLIGGKVIPPNKRFGGKEL